MGAVLDEPGPLGDAGLIHKVAVVGLITFDDVTDGGAHAVHKVPILALDAPQQQVLAFLGGAVVHKADGGFNVLAILGDSDSVPAQRRTTGERQIGRGSAIGNDLVGKIFTVGIAAGHQGVGGSPGVPESTGKGKRAFVGKLLVAQFAVVAGPFGVQNAFPVQFVHLMDGVHELGIANGEVQLAFMHIIRIQIIHTGKGAVDAAGAGFADHQGVVGVGMSSLVFFQQGLEFSPGEGFGAVGPLLTHQLDHFVIAADEAVHGIGIVAVPVGQVIVISVRITSLVQGIAVHGHHVGHLIQIIGEIHQSARFDVLVHDIGGTIHQHDVRIVEAGQHQTQLFTGIAGGADQIQLDTGTRFQLLGDGIIKGAHTGVFVEERNGNGFFRQSGKRQHDGQSHHHSQHQANQLLHGFSSLTAFRCV